MRNWVERRLQCSEPEATALGRHFSVPDALIILDHEFPDESGQGTGAEIRMALAMIGIHGLQHANFCSANRFGRLPHYPREGQTASGLVNQASEAQRTAVAKAGAAIK